jgi:hypothetical protein
MKYILPAIVLLTLTGAGCAAIGHNPQTGTPSNPTPSAPSSTVQANTTITYYISADSSTKYCNGADMNSADFKNALTKKVTTTVGGILSTQDEIINTLMEGAAAEGWNNAYTRVDSTTYDNGVVTLRPASGWAGSSIFMCAWQPFVEKNLQQFTEIKQVKWEYDGISAAGQGYYIVDDYLWHNGKKVFDQKIKDLANLPKDKKWTDYTSANEWFRYDDGNKLYIFIGMDTGVDAYTGNYIQINKDNNSGAVKFDSNLLGFNNFSVLSPDNSMFAYLKVDSWEKGDESIWVYNWQTKLNKKIFDIPSDETVLSCGDGCMLNSSLIYWTDANHVFVQTIKQESESKYSLDVQEKDKANLYNLKIN